MTGAFHLGDRQAAGDGEHFVAPAFMCGIALLYSQNIAYRLVRASPWPPRYRPPACACLPGGLGGDVGTSLMDGVILGRPHGLDRQRAALSDASKPARFVT